MGVRAAAWTRRTLLAVVAGQVALVWWAAGASFFTWDDYPNFLHALDEGLTWGYLTRETITIEHLAPAHRLANWLLQRAAPLNFTVALAFLLACLAASTLLLHRVLHRLSGGAWWVLVPTATFGASVATLAAAQWWAAGLHSLPSAALSLLAIAAWLRWCDDRSPGALATVVVAMTGAGLFYGKALLVPVYLVALALLSRRARPSPAWALLALPVVLYAGAALVLGYGPRPLPALAQLPAYAGLSWVRGLVPALANVPVTAGPQSWPREAGIIAAQALLLALVAASVARDRRAWRGWAFLAVAFLANVALHAVYRLAQFAPDLLAYEHRYYTELAYLVPIAVVLAFTPSGEGARRASPGGAALAVAAVAAHVALFGWAAAAQRDAWWGYAARPWMGNIVTDVGQLAAQGVAPVLLDGDVPEFVAPAWMLPVGSLSQVVRTFAPAVRFNATDGPLFAVAEDGHLSPAGLRPLVDVAAAGPELRDLERASAAPLCVRSGATAGALVHRAALDGQRLALRPAVTTDPPAALPVLADGRPATLLTAGNSGGGAIVELVTPRVAELYIEIPPATTACFAALEVLDIVTTRGPAPG